jgi:sugar-specific transcriptional regulator TrmB
MITTLLKIGLTLNDIKVYKGYLKCGAITAAELARRLNMDKSSCYRATANLETKGLIIRESKTKGSKVQASDPKNLKYLYESTKKDLLSQENSLDNLIESLKVSSKFLHRDTSIKIEKGIQAHLNAMEDSIIDNKDKIIYEKWEMKNPIFLSKEYNKFVNEFAKRRIKLSIKDLYLSDSGLIGMFTNLMKTSTKLNKEVRIYPKDANDKNSFRIYKDTVEIISFDEKNEFIVVLIKDKYITELMKTMFNFIWNRSKVYSRVD